MRAALALSARSFLRRVRVLEHGAGNGLLTHAIAIALLLPNLVIESPELSDSLERFGEPLREHCERLFVRAPSTVRAAQMESEKMRTSLIDVARALVETETRNDDAAPPELCLIGDLAKDRMSALLGEVERAPLGSAVPWMLLTELLGTTIRCRGVERTVLAGYRTILARRLAELAEQSAEIFLQALVEDAEPALHEQLRSAVDALRAAAVLAA